MGDTRDSYDRVARTYKEQFEHELDEKPFDRDFLDRFAAGLPAGSTVIDAGCGPGQIGRYLAAHSVQVVGVDLSLEMLRQASSGKHLCAVAQADMRRLPLRDASVQGLVAFYSLIHIPPDDLEVALAEMGRAVAPGGHVGVAVHATQPPERATAASPADPIPGGGLRIAEMLSQPVDLEFYFYDLARLTGLLEAAGFEILWAQERDPYPGGVEVQTRRAYALARKAAARRCWA